ncbi:hypothetical protein ACLI4R_16885 [Natrialbaceae archaeon A-chndr2]|uniref:hypothetical protein n=1 Tax=Natronosalvus amylolyticus TaxID=2961994 RepID=UPI0020C9A3A0|nr:hypothetical protein [Natronosalvus amylolyticus]
MARDKPVQNSSSSTHQPTKFPNLVTLVGRGIPSRFEIAVDGQIEMVDADPLETATIVSGGVAEGTIDVGIQQFRFSGEMANVHVADWNGNTAPTSKSVPAVHVDYGVER